MRTAIGLLLAVALAPSAAAADERPVASIALDARVATSSVSLAEQAAEESRGDDLSRFLLGAVLGVGLETGNVTVLATGAIYVGGLSAEAIADHYSGVGKDETALTFAVGLAGRYQKSYREKLSLLGDLALGYQRMTVGGAASAHLSSLYMEIGGGAARPVRLGGLETELALIVSLRAQRLSSFSAQGLTEGSLNVDSPSLALYPGLTLSYQVVF